MEPQDQNGFSIGAPTQGAPQPSSTQNSQPPTGAVGNSGFSIGAPGSHPAPVPADQVPSHNDEIKVDHPWYTPTGLLQRAGSVVEGIGEGAASTAAGASDLLSHANATQGPMGALADKALNSPTGQRVRDYLHKVAGDDNTPGSSNNYNKAGYGGETLLELFLGDEGLKGLSTADQVMAAGKAMKVVEKSPKLMRAAKIGAEHMAKAAAVQGTQTLVRSGGDTGAALESAALGGATAGVFSGAASGVGALAEKFGTAGKTAADLADTAANAPDKGTIVDNIKGQLLNAKDALHKGYEAGVNALVGRLGDESVEVKGSPVSEKAKQLLANPDPEDHDLTKAAKDVAGDKLDKSTRSLLENYANGTKPLSEEDIAAAEEANKPSKLVGADGKPVVKETVEPQAQPAEPLTAKDLVDQRQAIRKAAAGYEPGDINARALNGLLYGIDDTLDKIAEKSQDATALSDYQNLRADYGSKINVFNKNPIVKNLMAGNVDDAAKGFVASKSASGLPTAGKTDLNTDQLRNVLGDEGFTHFRDSVFTNLMQTASDNNGFNPAKFVTTWNKIADSTKGNFFGAADPAIAPQNFVTALTQDAKTAANVQKLVRGGVLAGPGAVASYFAPAAGSIATALGFVFGHEGMGGISKGRDILDYVANHPKTWAAMRKAGSMAQSAGADVAGTATRAVPTAAVGLSNANDADKLRSSAYQIAQDALSKSSPAPTTSDQVVVPQNDDKGVQQVKLPVTTPPQ